MKKYLLILFLLMIPIIYAQDYEIKGYVNDYANILTVSEEAEISDILKQIHDSGVAQYAVMTVPNLNGQDIEGFTYNIAEGNLGDTDKNNGLLLLIAVEDRLYRFEVGRGLEPIMPDILAGRIGRNFLTPNFQNGDYFNGIKEASLSVRDVLLENTESEYYPQEYEDTAFVIFVIFVIIMIMFIVFISAIAKPKKPGRNDNSFWMAAWLLSNMMRGGKGGSGGFSGGGFGGFGGGSFGGGGASGGW